MMFEPKDGTKGFTNDIFEFDELPSDTVRLSAVTIQELFKSTDYNLEDINCVLN